MVNSFDATGSAEDAFMGEQMMDVLWNRKKRGNI